MVEVFGKFKSPFQEKISIDLNISEWSCGTEPVKYPPEPLEIPPDRGFTILGLFISFIHFHPPLIFIFI